MPEPLETSEPQSLREQLVAYLDGELSPDEEHQVERLLADDPAVRAELQRLQRAWDELDVLPRAETDHHFTSATLEAVAATATMDLAVEQTRRQARRRNRWVQGSLALAMAAAAGFWGTALWWPDPNRELARDLPVLERLDMYRQAGSIEFLRLLHEEGEFSAEGTDGT